MNEELSEIIVENVDLLKYVRQYIQLENMDGKNYFGLCPFHYETDSSFSVNVNDKLWYCFGCKTGGSIIQFVMKYDKLSYNQSIEKLQEYSNIDINNIPINTEIVRYLKSKKKKTNFADYKHKILNANILNKFCDMNFNNSWTLDEEIPLITLKKYNVKFDETANRIVYPIHDIDNNLINIKGRTLNPNFKELGIRKYTYYYPVGTHDFLFGLNFKKDILGDEVFIFESAKSVMKMDSFGLYNALSMETSKMTDLQERLLLKLNVKNVIIALDKGIGINTIKRDFSRLSKFVNLYIIYDSKDVLKNKNSPIDQGIEDFKILYNRRFRL